MNVLHIYDMGYIIVTSTGTMVTNGFPCGLVWFKDGSLAGVLVALLCRRYRFNTWFAFCWLSG